MKKIFMIGLGGSVPGANIEVHDMQFVYAESLEETYEVLKERWYGSSLHIDSYREFTFIDGYKVIPNGDSKEDLFMIVYGGYNPEEIDEVHKYAFVFATDEIQAKTKAKQMMKNHQHIDHVDSIVNVAKSIPMRLGFQPSSKTFSDSKLTHTFIKLK